MSGCIFFDFLTYYINFSSFTIYLISFFSKKFYLKETVRVWLIFYRELILKGSLFWIIFKERRYYLQPGFGRDAPSSLNPPLMWPRWFRMVLLPLGPSLLGNGHILYNWLFYHKEFYLLACNFRWSFLFLFLPSLFLFQRSFTLPQRA